MRKLRDILRDQQRPDDRDLTSRSDLRKQERAKELRLAELAKRLVSLTDKRLGSLGLPDDLMTAIGDAKRIGSATARNRQLRLIRQLLRPVDADGLAGQLEASSHPGLHAGVISYWSERLVEDGDRALDEFIVQYPFADRKRLRQLARNASRVRPGRPAEDGALREAIRLIVTHQGA